MADLSQLNVNNNDYNLKDAAARNDIQSTQVVSGNPITLTDAAPINAESLVVELEPKQDLHGQQYPYVGGAGKNKLPMKIADIKAENTGGTWSGNVYTYGQVTFSIETDDAGNVTGIKVNGTASTTVVFWLGHKTYTAGTYYIAANVSTGTNDVFFRMSGPGKEVYTINKNNYVANTYTELSLTESTDLWGNIRVGRGETVNNLLFKPFYGLTESIFEPYSNICPITGYTETKVESIGKNQCPLTLSNLKLGNTSGTWTGNSYTHRGVQFDVRTDSGGNITGIEATRVSSNSNDAQINVYITSSLSDFEGSIPSGNYYFSGAADGGGTGSDPKYYMYGYDSTTSSRLKRWDGTTDSYALFDSTSYTEIQVDGSHTCRLIIIVKSSENPQGILFKPMIRLATEQDTTYEPYQSTSATIQFGQTVYGGVCDFVEGGTSDEWAVYEFDGTETAVAYGQGYRYADILTDAYKSITSHAVPDNVMTNWGFAPVSRSNIDAGTTDNAFSITDSTVMVSTNNVAGLQIAYKKATASSIATPPTPLKLLKGTNNLSADGVMQIGYQPDNVIGELKGMIQDLWDYVLSQGE